MAREYSRTQRVGDFLQQELALLIQRELRDPRVAMVSVTAVDVSRDLSHAKVFFTQLGVDDAAASKATTDVLNKASGFLRSQLARSATMRTVPRLHFQFDESVGRGREMEALLRDVREADQALQNDASNPSRDD
jgi:ribosome-binding factor A